MKSVSIKDIVKAGKIDKTILAEFTTPYLNTVNGKEHSVKYAQLTEWHPNHWAFVYADHFNEDLPVITFALQAFDVEKLKCKFYALSVSGNNFITPKDLLVHEFVGNLSEGIISCSYNEDEIRELWNNSALTGYINEHRTSVYGLGEYCRCISQVAMSWLPFDGDFDKAVSYLVKQYGGWPTCWSSEPEYLDPLTEKEKVLITNNFS